MYILNKSFISKEYSAVVDRIEGSFLDGASLISQLENEMFIEVGGRGGERREKRSLNISLAYLWSHSTVQCIISMLGDLN